MYNNSSNGLFLQQHDVYNISKAEPLAVRANFVNKALSKVGMYIGFLSVHFVVEEVHFFG